jgi:signal transduction histidine kinase
MLSVTRLPPVLFVLAAAIGAFHLSRRRLGEARTRIAWLEARAARLADDAQAAVRLGDDFLATLSHELRTPLNATLGWAQLLRLHASDPAMRAHAIDAIERNARAQAQVVANLLDTSRIITGRMRMTFKPVDLERIVRHTVDGLLPTAAAKQLALDVRAQPGTMTLGDAPRLQQVVWNLVANAIKFTPAGGAVHVRVRRHPSAVELEVTDTGIGISADLLPVVFDRFRQGDSGLKRTHGGLGLGLAIVKYLVELHGGTVEVRSKGASRGATFRVFLPVRSVEESA